MQNFLSALSPSIRWYNCSVDWLTFSSFISHNYQHIICCCVYVSAIIAIYTKSIQDGFNTDMRTPCIVFTGHPSLRFGDAVHFMELWRSSSANLVVFTGKTILSINQHEEVSWRALEPKMEGVLLDLLALTWIA